MGKQDAPIASLQQINNPVYRLTVDLTQTDYNTLQALLRTIARTTLENYDSADDFDKVTQLGTLIKKAL